MVVYHLVRKPTRLLSSTYNFTAKLYKSAKPCAHKIALRAEKLSGLSRNGPLVRYFLHV